MAKAKREDIQEAPRNFMVTQQDTNKEILSVSYHEAESDARNSQSVGWVDMTNDVGLIATFRDEKTLTFWAIWDESKRAAFFAGRKPVEHKAKDGTDYKVYQP